MTAEHIAAEALKLTPEEREQLADKLYSSLGETVTFEYEKEWAAVALQRSAEMDANPSIGIPADEVFRKAFEKLK
jgi:putative addiction module component (TIGR02574 family)